LEIGRHIGATPAALILAVLALLVVLAWLRHR
jgi:hypothetical protein